MTPDDPPDRELWTNAVSGGASAFGTLFDRHAKAVYNHCFRLCASWSHAEDLTQATFRLAHRDRVVLEPGRGCWRSRPTWSATTGAHRRGGRA